ncbi:MAG TPA: cohesin domain-containing protein [Dehalococcoidia bacterium]|nr:cohesin domain-containing protein [Dehalococcoidia bacterium]
MFKRTLLGGAMAAVVLGLATLAGSGTASAAPPPVGTAGGNLQIQAPAAVAVSSPFNVVLAETTPAVASYDGYQFSLLYDGAVFPVPTYGIPNNDVPATSMAGPFCPSSDTPPPVPGAPPTYHLFVGGCIFTGVPGFDNAAQQLTHITFTAPAAPGATDFHMVTVAEAGPGGTNMDAAGSPQVSTYNCGPLPAYPAGNCGPFPSPPFPAGTTATDTLVQFVLPPPTLSVTKTATTATVVAGSSDSYTIAVKNTSATTTAYNVTVTDTFPAGISGVAAGSDVNCTVTAPSATCTIASIAPGATHTFTPVNVLTAGNSGGTSPTNTASANCTGNGGPAGPACAAAATGSATINILSPAVSWAKSPTNANIWLCGENMTGGADNYGPTCPAVVIAPSSGTPMNDPGDITAPNNATGVWQDGVILNEILSNPSDPNGLGGYQFDLNYDPNVFDFPVIQDTGNMNVGGHVTVCSMTISLPGVVHVGCAAGSPLGGGATWIGPKTMATVRLDVAELVEKTIRPNKENGTYTDVVDTNTRVTNTCGQPLNDGTIQPLPGQPECQGNPLLGVGPGGSLPDTEARYTIRRLEGDIVPDCVVNTTDAQLEASKFGLSSGSLLYNKFFDVNLPLQFGDGEIDINDIQFVFGRLGSTCNTPLPAQPAIPTP